jgi:peptidoglycan/LPS O-acetylase OafA/YrhL
MVNIENIKKIFAIIWLIILVFLWVSYPFFPGDIFFWMWLAIIWSIIGGVVGTIFFMSESKKNEKIIGVIWAFILVILWIFYPYFPGNILAWLWTAIIWSIIGLIMAISLFIIKKLKK